MTFFVILFTIALIFVFIDLYKIKNTFFTPLKVKIWNTNRISDVPKYGTSGSSGLDLHSDLDCVIKPKERMLVKTGIYISIPNNNYEAQVRPRSGNALNKGLTILNTPGTIDSDYRGEIGVILYNTSESDIIINLGDKIAQLVFMRIEKV